MMIQFILSARLTTGTDSWSQSCIIRTDCYRPFLTLYTHAMSAASTESGFEQGRSITFSSTAWQKHHLFDHSDFLWLIFISIWLRYRTELHRFNSDSCFILCNRIIPQNFPWKRFSSGEVTSIPATGLENPRSCLRTFITGVFRFQFDRVWNSSWGK